MIRREFLRSVATVGAGTLATLGHANASNTETFTFQVQGFTCITCAVGLETLLLREKGVHAAKAQYPSGITAVSCNPRSTSKQALVAVIESMGFQAQAL